MPITPQASNEHPLSLNDTSNLVSLFEPASRIAQGHSDNNRLLRLTNQLQTSLELEEILHHFGAELASCAAHDCLAYNSDNYNQQHSQVRTALEFTLGKPARHRLSYQLTLNGETLGTLIISRKYKFTTAEIQEVENLICALLYPIRNALLYRKAIHAAHKDALTGTSNRAAFDEVMNREVELAHRHGRPLGMIVIDIDHFKHINDTFGHTTGDSLLKALAHSANSTIRLSDQIFRYGGEEFVVLLPETDIKGVKRLAERIRKNIAVLECVYDNHPIKMTASFGIATLKSGENEKSFFSRADKALYQAKSDGRNCSRVAD
jgi:diguanylate cyclase (GGDEF)-like protein